MAEPIHPATKYAGRPLTKPYDNYTLDYKTTEILRLDNDDRYVRTSYYPLKVPDDWQKKTDYPTQQYMKWDPNFIEGLNNGTIIVNWARPTIKDSSTAGGRRRKSNSKTIKNKRRKNRRYRRSQKRFFR